MWPIIISVAIPMAVSCSIYLYDVLNSRCRLLMILHCTHGGQFGDQLRWVSVPFSAPGLRQNPFCPRRCWAKWCLLPIKGAWCVGKRHWGLKTLRLCNCWMLSCIILRTFKCLSGTMGKKTIVCRQSTIKVPAIPLYIHNITQQQGYLHCNACSKVKT